mgnify:CR=1 FL=1
MMMMTVMVKMVTTMTILKIMIMNLVCQTGGGRPLCPRQGLLGRGALLQVCHTFTQIHSYLVIILFFCCVQNQNFYFQTYYERTKKRPLLHLENFLLDHFTQCHCHHNPDHDRRLVMVVLLIIMRILIMLMIIITIAITRHHNLREVSSGICFPSSQLATCRSSSPLRCYFYFEFLRKTRFLMMVSNLSHGYQNFLRDHRMHLEGSKISEKKP